MREAKGGPCVPLYEVNIEKALMAVLYIDAPNEVAAESIARRFRHDRYIYNDDDICFISSRRFDSSELKDSVWVEELGEWLGVKDYRELPEGVLVHTQKEKLIFPPPKF